MKHKLLSKSLLMAVGLFVGASTAWAEAGDAIYSNDFSTNDQTNFATWTATGKKPSGYSYAQIGRTGSFSILTGALVHTPDAGKSKSNVWNANVGVFNEAITTATQSNNYVMEFDVTLAITNHIACKDFIEFSDESKKVVLCLYADHTRSNSSTGATTYGYIVGGDNGFQVVEAGASGSLNAEGTIGNGTQKAITKAISGTTGSKTYHVKFDAKVALGTATLTIKEGETTIVDGASVNITANSGLKYICFEGYNSWETASTSTTIDNFSIVEGEASTEATAEYTVQYVATISGVETEIKTADATRIGVVDGTVSITDEDKNVIWYNDVKYLYSSDNASSTNIASDGSSVIKVFFTEAPTYTYTVSDNLGNTLASGSNYSGEAISYYWPAVRNINGTLYTAPAVSNQYKGTFTLTENTTLTPVTFTASETDTSLVYLAEGEDIFTESTENSSDIRCSLGKAGYATEAVGFVTLPAGTYYLFSSSRCNGEGTEEDIVYTAGTGEGATTLLSQKGWGYNSNATSEPFTLTESTTIYMQSSSDKKLVDYVYIVKTAEIVSVSVAGYATLYSEYALTIPTGVKAYTGKVSGNKLVLSEVETTIPANTAVVLEAGEGSYSFAVTTADAFSGENDLKGVLAETAIDPNSVLVLGYEDSEVGFYSFNGIALAAGKAYLEKPASGAPAIYFSFEDETEVTGVYNLRVEEKANAAFDLTGRRANGKGLMIQNGKVVLVK